MICQEMLNTLPTNVRRSFIEQFCTSEEVISAEIAINFRDKLQITDDNLQFAIGDTNEIVFGGVVDELDSKKCVEYTSTPYKMSQLFHRNFQGLDPKLKVFVFKDIVLEKWYFFDIVDVISYICDECTWKILENGHIRGYFKSKIGFRQYITYDGGFFGICKNKTIGFIELLKQNIVFYQHDDKCVVNI